jgi:hypothetical protein
LATYQTRYGDWRELFRSVDRIDKVTKADIRRVANETFNDTNRTVGVIETSTAPGRAASKALAVKTPATKPRRIREVRNEEPAQHYLVDSANRRHCCVDSPGHFASHRLEADSDSDSAEFPSAAAQAHSALQRHGDLPAGRS